ncbi:hypothetical protein B5J93_09970 [Moraxella equi]|nr:hypothetical protein B5J93_09970 [Moraxella equi]
MSSREIATLCEKEHRNVCRDIDNLNATYEEMGLLKIEQGYYTLPSTGNQKHREFYLTKEQCVDLISGYRTDIRIRINRRWQELEAQIATADPLHQIAHNMQKMSDNMQILANATTATMAKLDHTERYINLLELNQKGHIKVTPEVIAQVKAMKADGYSQANIGRLLRISSTTVSQIINGTYKGNSLTRDDNVARLVQTAKSVLETEQGEV